MLFEKGCRRWRRRYCIHRLSIGFRLWVTITLALKRMNRWDLAWPPDLFCLSIRLFDLTSLTINRSQLNHWLLLAVFDVTEGDCAEDDQNTEKDDYSPEFSASWKSTKKELIMFIVGRVLPFRVSVYFIWVLSHVNNFSFGIRFLWALLVYLSLSLFFIHLFILSLNLW